jgi:SOS-response transcriptional repressor LexA
MGIKQNRMENITFYRISCTYSTSRGESFCVEFIQHLDEPTFIMRRQAEGRLLHHQQKIDLALPYTEKVIAYEPVAAILETLYNHAIPILPPITGGFDGGYYYLKIQNSMTHIEFSWWLIAPDAWQPVEQAWQKLVALTES